MAGLVAELFYVILSKDGQEKITKQELDFFMNWRATALRSGVIGGSLAAGFVYAASRKLGILNRFILAGGAGLVAGSWRLQATCQTCSDKILGLDGSRLQHELKKLVLQRYGDDPQKMKVFSKYFYGEEVYSDSNPEYPRLIFRQRRVFMENRKVTNDDAYGGSDADEREQNHQHGDSDRNSLKPKGSNKEVRQVRMNPGISMYGYGDPLEVLFGLTLDKDETGPTDASGDAAKVQGRHQKKLRRRQRMRQRQRHRHREALSFGQPQLFSG